MPSKSLILFLITLATTCLVVVIHGANATLDKAEVTFSKDVAPIFYQRCAECHRPNDMAPFSVMTYKEVLPWVESIRERVTAREMPPWHADSGYGEFLNDRRLTPKEIETIRDLG